MRSAEKRYPNWRKNIWKALNSPWKPGNESWTGKNLISGTEIFWKV
jgi:hypothetical protein